MAEETDLLNSLCTSQEAIGSAPCKPLGPDDLISIIASETKPASELIQQTPTKLFYLIQLVSVRNPLRF